MRPSILAGFSTVAVSSMASAKRFMLSSPISGMTHFTAAETYGNLDLVASGDEFFRVVKLGFKIVCVDVKRKTNFLGFDNVLIFSGFLFALRLLKAVFSVIHNFAHRRICAGCDFYEIEISLLGNSQGLFGRHDAKLFSVSGNYADLTVADLFVDGKLGLADRTAPPKVFLTNKKG